MSYTREIYLAIIIIMIYSTYYFNARFINFQVYYFNETPKQQIRCSQVEQRVIKLVCARLMHRHNGQHHRAPGRVAKHGSINKPNFYELIKVIR